jgi:hypothetical protein
MPYRLALFYRAQPFNTSARFAARPSFPWHTRGLPRKGGRDGNDHRVICELLCSSASVGSRYRRRLPAGDVTR